MARLAADAGDAGRGEEPGGAGSDRWAAREEEMGARGARREGMMGSWKMSDRTGRGQEPVGFGNHPTRPPARNQTSKRSGAAATP